MFFKSNQQFLEKKQREIYYSRDMKRVLKNFKGHKHLLFMDFEGTQFSHEMIAFGAVMKVRFILNIVQSIWLEWGLVTLF